jgi:hypothetical protein
MKLLSKTFIVLLLIPTLLFANNDPRFKGKYTKTKTLNKEYTVNANAVLEVDNSYGNIDVVSWNENRTVIEVVITTNGDDEGKVQEKLNTIDVEFSGNGSRVVARTIFNDRKSSSWNWWGKKNSNIHMKINYTIKLPVTNSVDLNNDYGTISLNELEGNASISCDYGQVNIGKLMAENNSLSFDYSKNSTIGYMRNGKIDADYSSFTLDKVGNLELSSDYTKSEVMEAQSIDYNNDYGALTVGKAGKIMGRGNYIPLRVTTLTGELNVNSDYGSITVDRITGTGGDITIRSDYAGIKLRFDADYYFDFVVDLSYAGFNGKDGLEIMKESKDHSDKYYSGYHGKKGSGNIVNIRSEYGSVTLERN